MKLRVIYLAGGFPRGNDFDWREHLKKEAPMHAYIDPAKHGLKETAAYTEWDVEGVHTSDLLILVLESSNPGGYNCGFEAGIAYDAGKEVWVVDLMDADDPRKRYFGMISHVAEHVFDNLHDVVGALRTNDGDNKVRVGTYR